MGLGWGPNRRVLEGQQWDHLDYGEGETKAYRPDPAHKLVRMMHLEDELSGDDGGDEADHWEAEL